MLSRIAFPCEYDAGELQFRDAATGRYAMSCRKSVKGTPNVGAEVVEVAKGDVVARENHHLAKPYALESGCGRAH